jgi:hypothetical protein
MTRRLVPLSLAIFSTIASAQTVTVHPPESAITRIRDIERDSSQLVSFAQPLFDSIGPRLTGSPNLRSAQAYIIARYAAWGIGAKVEDYGTWRSWLRGPTHVDLISPRVRSLEAIMLAWSPGTGGKDVDGEVVAMPAFATPADFQNFLATAKGKFVLVSIAQPTCRPDTTWAVNATPATYQKMKTARALTDSNFAQSLRAAGVTVRDLPDSLERAGALGAFRNTWSGGWGVDRIFSARTKTMPLIDASCEDFGLMARLAMNGQHPRVRVNTTSAFQGEVPVGNVIATIPGGAKKDEYVMLSSHFDSWDGSSGATDNGTGTIVMMEAMRILKIVLPHPKRTIISGHWSGEEEGLIGSRAYAADHQAIVNSMQALFNQDNGTGHVAQIGLQGLTGAEPFFRRWFAEMPDSVTAGITINAPGAPGRGGTDNASFICWGAPAFGLGSTNWDYFSYTWHTNRDTYDKIVWDEVRKNATLVAMLAYLASEDDATMPRDKVELKDPKTGAAVAWPECTAPLRNSSLYAR